MRDLKDLHGLHGGMNETGTENLAWVLPAVTERSLARKVTLANEPPIRVGTPEPCSPPGKQMFESKTGTDNPKETT